MTSKIPDGLLALVVAFLAVLSLCYTFMAIPVADDFCRGALSIVPQHWYSYATHLYATWSGRWAAALIYSSIFPQMGLDTLSYNLFISLSIPLWLAVFYLAIRMSCRDDASRRQSLFFAALACAIYWSDMAAPGQTWYWATGMVEYQLPTLLMALGAFLVFRVAFGRWGPARRSLAIAAAVAIGLVLGGLNELVSLYFSGFTALLLVVALLRRDRAAASLLVLCLAAAAVGFLISFVAPGNALRIARDFPHSGRLGATLVSALAELDQSALAWLVNFKLWALLVLILCRARWRHDGAPAFSLRGWRLSWMSVFVAAAASVMIASLLGRLAVAYGQGAMLPARVLNIQFGVFLFGFLMTLPLLARSLHARGLQLSAIERRNIGGVAAILLAVGLVASPNTVTAWDELRHSLRKFYPAAVERTALMRSSSGQSEVVLQPFDFYPSTLFQPNLRADPAYWANACYARYYEVGRVSVVQKPSEP